LSLQTGRQSFLRFVVIAQHIIITAGIRGYAEFIDSICAGNKYNVRAPNIPHINNDTAPHVTVSIGIAISAVNYTHNWKIT